MSNFHWIFFFTVSLLCSKILSGSGSLPTWSGIIAVWLCVNFIFVFLQICMYLRKSLRLRKIAFAILTLACLYTTCEGYCLFNWSFESSARHTSVLITSRRGHAVTVSFDNRFFFFKLKREKSGQRVFFLNKKFRYAKSRMGMRKKTK